MNIRSTKVYQTLLLSALLCSCQQPKEEPKQVPVKEVIEYPTEMIKSPDGNYYFPDNIHRPKSDNDSLVLVYPSDLKK
jgi:hypothetical protein